VNSERDGIFREEALRRYAASRQHRESMPDVPTRLIVLLWVCAGLLAGATLWVASNVTALLR
jgi:hypothetical protein